MPYAKVVKVSGRGLREVAGASNLLQDNPVEEVRRHKGR
jgi:hypothetical protein